MCFSAPHSVFLTSQSEFSWERDWPHCRACVWLLQLWPGVRLGRCGGGFLGHRNQELCGHPLGGFNVAAFGFERERFISPKERNSTSNSKTQHGFKVLLIMEAPSPVVMIMRFSGCPKTSTLNLSGPRSWCVVEDSYSPEGRVVVSGVTRVTFTVHFILLHKPCLRSSGFRSWRLGTPVLSSGSIRACLPMLG